jgi:hypothetical protein
MAAAREEKRRAVVRRRGAAGREKIFEGILKGERVLDVRRKVR